ncbi:vitellogenin-2-like [Carettochelys insculpta]|uniref:vitellogenin-2-like n=1 Tax=Carettochelys insculpta TaxID=44489 RepID=UPI003EBB75E5
MKSLILALVFTFVGSQTYNTVPGFSNSKTYLYSYEGLILHGLQDRGLARAGLKLTCKIEISGLPDSYHFLKIRSPQLDEYNGIWPRDPVIRSPKRIQTITSCLTRLFKFEYNRGQFGNIYAPKDTPVTCVNIVRGILNVLQITVKKSQNAYDLQEAGIEGVCHTRYIILEDRKSNRVTISKTKDLNNCQDKVAMNMGMAYIRACATCPLREKIIKGTAAFTYKMKYTDAGALITEAVSQQVYQISPFSEPAGVAVVEARQELILNDIRSNEVITSEIELQNYGRLHYHFAKELLQMPVHLITMKNPESQIVEILQQLNQHNPQVYNKEAPAKFLELIQLCRVATPENLESLWKHVADKPQNRRWLLSAICAAGTTETFMFLKQKIQNEDFTYLESAFTIALAFHLSKADDHTLQAVADLVTSFQVQRAPVLRRLAYLAYGSMISRYCSVVSSCPKEILQPLHDLAAEAVSKNHEADMALALKAIGNAGEPASMKHVLKFLPIFSPAAMSVPVRIYTDAVLALRKIARKAPAKVQEILLQIFVDHSLDPTVRMMACVVIFETKPALPLVTTMANVLLKESSLQVASFTYSHMKALAMSRIPQLYNVSAACNIAIKLLSPRLDRLSYRYSKVIHVGGYYLAYRAGAIGRVYLMNSPSSMLPSAIIMKLRGYYANTATDFVEVALQAQGLTDLIRKQNIPFAEFDTYKKLKVLGKTLLGWKELPPENPLISAYIKTFGHELAFADVNKELIQQTVKALTESSDRHMLVKNMIDQVQRSIAGQWTLAVLAGEVRHIVPTCVGLPLEFSLYSTGLIHVPANVCVNMSPSLSGNFKPLQFFDANVQLHVDMNPSICIHTIATMGINTRYLQSGLEFQAKFHANIPLKFDAKIKMKDKSLKLETAPCHEEIELVTTRTKVYAISRNVEDTTLAKRTSVLPEEAVLDISEQHFKSSEMASENRAVKQRTASDVMSEKYSNGPEEESPRRARGRAYARVFCSKFHSLGCQTCLNLQFRDTAFLKDTFLHRLVGEREVKLALKPVHTAIALDKIQLEVQAGSRAASRIIHLLAPLSEEEDDSTPDDVVQTKLKKILRIESIFKAAKRSAHQHTKKPAAKKDKAKTPPAKYQSSSSLSSASSASSSSSSSVGDKYRIKDKKDKTWQPQQREESNSGNSQNSNSRSCSSSEENYPADKEQHRVRSCSSSSSSSSDSEYTRKQANPEIYQYQFTSAHIEQYPRKKVPKSSSSNSSSSSSSSSGSSDEGSYQSSAQSKFLGDSKPPTLAVFLHAIRNDRKLSGFQLVLYTDLHSSRPRIQVFVSNITESSRWKLCVDALIVNSYKAMGSLKWGQDCQDYRIAGKVASGQFADYPAAQIKLEWRKVPSRIKSVARCFYTFIPGLAYMLGFSQRKQNNPSQQATLVVALPSPRICDVVLRLPDLTIYDKEVSLPLPFPMDPHISPSELTYTAWNFFTKIPTSVIENLKGRCSVSQNMITTFDEVEFNYSMPANCYHVLAQDCSPELKFLVMMKKVEESPDLKAINVKLASHEIDMYPSNGRIQLMINGVQTPAENLPHTSNSDAYMLISREKTGLSLKAPEYGIDKLYYDGHTLKVQVGFWMTGKTCGICGKYDGESKQKYQMPSGYAAKDEVSFGHSWILSEEPCAGGCKLQRTLIKIEKPVGFEKVASKCYSVEPILRCVKGCSAVGTAPVFVGFHCVPADSTTNFGEDRIRLDQKSEDLENVVDAHTMCSCEQLQCVA